MLPHIPFNKPFITGKELCYIAQAITAGQVAGDGEFTRRCSRVLEEQFGIQKVLMTSSCTAALEIAAMLCELGPGDEVILPSFTFVSTANAFIRGGATPVFVDIRPDTLNLDEHLLEAAVTPRTRVIVPVHYAGVACAMERLMTIATHHQLVVVEDAAQGVNAFYAGRALGSMGHLGTYSFHATKNYIAGEGGALCLNAPALVDRAEILRDKGTNRRQFIRGEVDKYTWVDVGVSAAPSELCCAFLYAQLQMLDVMTARRRHLYETYYDRLRPLEARGLLRLPCIPASCVSNYHLFYILLPTQAARNALLAYLQQHNIQAAFHYIPLHSSPMGQQFGYKAEDLPITEEVSGCLLRLPLYYDLTEEQQRYVVQYVTKGVERFAKDPPC